ncbi:MAG: cysteine hydrolase [Cohaesibacter sp.]|jgi:nicotinamidase-related amidase|nr:cysteine hydrolase [Cohaesibacter sp.]
MELILGAILAGIVFLMANGLFAVTNRPKITKIDLIERPGAALVVIDMQKDYTQAPPAMAHDSDKMAIAFTQINQAAKDAKTCGMAVIEVSHIVKAGWNSFKAKLFEKGAGISTSEGLGRDEALTFEADFHLIKHERDAFSNPELEIWLKDQQIGHLYITGQEAVWCVATTARSALARGYDVTLLEEAILNRFPEKWSEIKDKLKEDGARVLPAARFCEELERKS